MFQLFRHANMAGEGLELLHRRSLIVPLVAWLPLMLLSVLDHHALGQSCKIPFMHDVESYVRFLVALPILIGAELVVHRRISPLVRAVRGKAYRCDPRFAGVQSSGRLSDANSRLDVGGTDAAGSGLYSGTVDWRREGRVGRSNSVCNAGWETFHLTLAGYWYALVSIPVFQFILLRWYMRLGDLVPASVADFKINLRLSAVHPDRSGGIGCPGRSSYALGPLLFAQGALLSGLIASRVLYEGRGLLSFKTEAAGFVGFFRFDHPRSLVDVYPAARADEDTRFRRIWLTSQSVCIWL